jgi:hypothetical protein
MSQEYKPSQHTTVMSCQILPRAHLDATPARINVLQVVFAAYGGRQQIPASLGLSVQIIPLHRLTLSHDIRTRQSARLSKNRMINLLCCVIF